MEGRQGGILGWAACLMACIAAGTGHAAVIEPAQLGLSLSRWTDDATRMEIGTGYFRYDAASVRQELDDWLLEWQEWQACEAAGGLDCEWPDLYRDVGFPVIDAVFTMYGHTFRDDEIRWTESYSLDDWDGSIERDGMEVEMGQASRDPYLFFGAGDEDWVLEYSVAGNTGYCVDYGCNGFEVGSGYDEDYRDFDWGEVPVPAPEHGSPVTFIAALFALLGFAGRRERRYSPFR